MAKTTQPQECTCIKDTAEKATEHFKKKKARFPIKVY
jgi:hypothetical protein